MIYVSLKGRMCNQMFQIATAKALAIDNSTDFICSNQVAGIIPTPEESRLYRKTTLRNVQFAHLYPMNYVLHNDPPNFSYEKIKYHQNILLNGYYQSEKYFKEHRQQIIELYECPSGLESVIEGRFKSLLGRNDTCSVHVRRGDYIKYKDYHNNLSTEYYENCFYEKKGSHLVFFSDDIEWCKETFKNKEATFVDTESDVVEFYLMSRMKDNIISNSSFSWWAAWMNLNEDKHVIAPKKWFGPKNTHFLTEDIIPKTWELINA